MDEQAFDDLADTLRQLRDRIRSERYPDQFPAKRPA
jgi:hypothetical protein